MNAIYDAIGVRIKSLPATPEKILSALREKQRKSLNKSLNWFIGTNKRGQNENSKKNR